MGGFQSAISPFQKTDQPIIVPGGLYITLEGPEGCGKSTQLALLNKRLAEEGYNVIATKQPGGTEVGAAIRRILLHPEYTGKISPKTESLLFWADRHQHHETLVKPALAEGSIVLGDRDFDSSWAYQAYARGLGEDWMQQLHEAVVADFKPHRTILLAVPLRTVLERVAKRNATTDIGSTESRIDSETAEFHEKVRDAFFVLADREPDRFVVVDGSESIETVHDAVYAAVKSALLDQVHAARRLG